MRASTVLVAALVAACLFSAQARAQAARTWVSGVGDDANPCSITAPCKTFAGAISKTAASGEISVLTSGGFGSVTITKAISIVAVAADGSILGSGTNGVVINAGPNDVVSLYGLKFEGTNSGLNGIRILQAGTVYISHTLIRGFTASPGRGIDIEPTNGPLIYLKDVEINNNLTGIYMHSGAATTGLVMDSCTIAANTTNSILFDTSTSVGRAQGSAFANTAAVAINGAKLISNGNNFFAGGSTTPTLSPLQ